MKYVKKFGELITEREVVFNNADKRKFKELFFKEYPKKETKIFYADRDSTYELEFYDLKMNSNTTYDLIFNAENNYKVYIKNPYYISDKDAEKISLFPVTISPESKELVDKMFDWGASTVGKFVELTRSLY